MPIRKSAPDVVAEILRLLESNHGNVNLVTLEVGELRRGGNVWPASESLLEDILEVIVDYEATAPKEIPKISQRSPT